MIRSRRDYLVLLLWLVLLVCLALVWFRINDSDRQHKTVPNPAALQPVGDNDPKLVAPTPGYSPYRAERIARSQQVSCEVFQAFVGGEMHGKALSKFHKKHPDGVERPAGCKLPAGIPEPFARPDQTNGTGELNQPGDPGPVQDIPPTTLPPVN